MNDQAEIAVGTELAQVDFLALSPHWRCIGVRVTDHSYEVEAQLLAEPDCCPHCSSSPQVLQPCGQKRRSVLDAPVHGKYQILHFTQTRYRCAACGRTSGQPLPGLDKRRHATTRLVELIGVEAFRKNFSQVAAETGASPSMVRDIFVERAAALELSAPPQAPRQLGLDEIFVQGRTRLLLTDLGAHRPVEILPGTDMLALCKRLLALQCRGQVEVVVLEPQRQLLETVRRVLPQAVVIVNKWTVLRLAERALVAVLQQTCTDVRTPQRQQLMSSLRLLRKGSKRLSHLEGEALRTLLEQYPDLRVAHELKREFYGLWNYTARGAAEAQYATWEQSVPPRLYSAFGPLIQFMSVWRSEVFSYFDHRLTNAFTEAMSAKLQTMQLITSGQSFATLRAKMLYGTRMRRPARSVRVHRQGASA